MHAMLERGGLLILDDLHLYSVRQLFLFLKAEDGFTLIDLLAQKTALIRKDHDRRYLGDFDSQPFILMSSVRKVEAERRRST